MGNSRTHMDREAIKSIIEKQKTVLNLALGKGMGSSDTRVDEVVAENAQYTITEIEKLLELQMHPDPEINKEVNADILIAEEADKQAGLSHIIPLEQVVIPLDDNWLPTPENLNMLPEPLRLFIHDLETRCDPAGDTSQLALQKDTIKGLEKTVEEQKEVFANWTPTPENILELPDSVREFVNKMQMQLVDIEQKDSVRTKEHNDLVLSVKKHHDQKGDDRCWLDDVELYTAAGLDDANSALPQLPEFIGNCVRFHQSRQNPDSRYVTVEEQLDKVTSKATYLMRQVTKVLKQVLQYHSNRKGISRLLVKDVERAVEKMEKFG